MQDVYGQFLEDELALYKHTHPNPSLDLVNSKLTRESFDGEVSEGFQIFQLVNILADNNEEARERIQAFENTDAFKFFREHTGRIEVVIDDELQRVYFPVQPVCTFLPPAAK